MHYVARGLLVLALLGACAGVFLYAKGGFEVPFVERPVLLTEEITTHEITTEQITTEEPTTEIDELVNVMNPDDLSPATEQQAQSTTEAQLTEQEKHRAEIDRIMSGFANTFDLYDKGFSVSDDAYRRFDSEKTAKTIADYKRLRDQKYQADLANSNDPDSFVFEEPYKAPIYEYVWSHAPAKTDLDNKLFLDKSEQTTYLTPKFGMIFLYSDQGYRVLGADSTPYFLIPRGGEIQFMNEMDSNNRAIFKVGDGYYYYDRASNQFVRSDYIPGYESRGIVFNYPSYYGGAGDSGLKRFYDPNNMRFGFKSLDESKVVVWGQYPYTFNFSEGVGTALAAGNRLYFFNSAGNIINRKYYAPNTSGEESLGYYYFDHGLTRVLEKHFSNTNFLMYQTDLLVYKDFTQFELPKDYTMKSYSDGVILLEKNGKYGFMNYNGDWIAQPIYTYAKPFREGVAVLGLANGKKALIDTEGKTIVPFAFDHISSAGGGVVTLYDNDLGWFVLNKMVKKIEY